MRNGDYHQLDYCCDYSVQGLDFQPVPPTTGSTSRLSIVAILTRTCVGREQMSDKVRDMLIGISLYGGVDDL